MSLGTVQGLSTERWEVFSKVHPRGVWDMFVTQTRPSFVRGAGLLAAAPPCSVQIPQCSAAQRPARALLHGQ